MRATTLAILALLILPLAYAQEAGRGFYFHVTDCGTGQPIAGAVVIVTNGSSGDVASTNSTGYSFIKLPDGVYNYYVSMEGYRTRGGELPFTAGMVYEICLFKATEGFWNIVPTVLMWQGDIHAGGLGWSTIRLKNLEDGLFNITRLEIHVAGYDKPIAVYEAPGGVVLEKVEKVFNVTVAPPQDSPTGRAQADLRVKAYYKQPDGRVMGPLTIPLDLGPVLIQPYRTMYVQLLDYWGLNNVPNATIILESSLTGARFTYKANGSGVVLLPRLPEGAYRITVVYDSPYDGQSFEVYYRSQVLADLAVAPVMNTKLYEVHVKMRSLSGRPLPATVYLGRVEGHASAEGLVVFRNVPRGDYRVSAVWEGVEVYRGSVRVDEPLARPSPGGLLEATAEVGDIILSLRDMMGRRLASNVSVTILPKGLRYNASEQVAFTDLPRGEYTVVATAYNRLLKQYVEVFRGVYRIPDDHGTVEAKLALFDARIRLLTSDGRQADISKVVVEGEEFNLVNGTAVVEGITAGRYRMSATYMGVAVLDEAVEVSGPVADVRTRIHLFQPTVLTRDGEPLATGVVTVEVSGRKVSSELRDGRVSMYLPEGTYPVAIVYRDVEVLRESVVVKGGEATLTANVAKPVVIVSDQSGNPLSGAEVELIGVGKAVTGGDGSATLQQLPVRDYPFRVSLGVEVYSGSLTPGTPAKVTVTLVSLVVKVVNDLGSPVQAEVDVTRGSKLLGRASGSEARFDRLPAGVYTVRASSGPRSAEAQVMLDKPVNEVVLTISGPLSDIMTIATPLVVAAAVVAALVIYAKVRRKAEAMLRK
ncbi:MAG: carboxypeptidase-like regulatory domain-containing protein [Candidatus Caldarchaeum sp.]